MEVGLIIVSGLELTAVYLIWRLWQRHHRRSLVFRICWSLLLLVPVLGIIFYRLAVNEPSEKPGWGSENNQGWGDP
jgi:uncharacterized membrane protein